MNARWTIRLFFLIMVFQVQAQTNLIVNGNFAGDSGWNDLGQYNDGQATGAVEYGAYVITITAPGTEIWSIQFTQTHLPLDSGTAYTLSFDISATVERSVEVSLSRNGGDYRSYSGRDTLHLSSAWYHHRKTFIMKQPTDHDVRLEFNCGKATGKIAIRSVKLVKDTSRSLQVLHPRAGEILFAGEPYTVTWSSVNVNGDLSVEVSADNGATWKKVGSVSADSGRYVWTPDADYSAWTRLRLTSVADGKTVAVSEGTFELAPFIDLVKNGLFTDSRGWSLGVYGGKASGGVTPSGIYHIAIETAASEPWQIQLVQNGLKLVKDNHYHLSFVAYAADAARINIVIGMDLAPFDPYIDTADAKAALTSSPKVYSLDFVMDAPTDTNARIEFNCGKAKGDVFIDEVSLTEQYVASAGVPEAGSAGGRRGFSRPVLFSGFPGVGAGLLMSGGHPSYGYRIVDLRGRLIPALTDKSTRSRKGMPGAVRGIPGVYLVCPERM